MKRLKSSAEVNKPAIKLERQDEEDLLQIFPAEIWSNIVIAAHPCDAQNIRQSSTFLGCLVTPVEFIFAPVLKCVLPYILDNNTRYRLLKNCRLVCHLWCRAVNSVLQEESPHTRIETGKMINLPQYPQNLQHFRVKFKNQENVLSRFENHFKDTHLKKGRNPFVTRHVEICYNADDSKNFEYLLHLYKILKMCGSQIWYLNVFITLNNPKNDFQELRGLVELLPNLKVFTVYNVPMFASAKTWMPYLQSFRHMPKLQCVKTYGDHSEALVKALLENNRQVRSIVFTQVKEADGRSMDLVNLLPDLERLRVTSYNMSGFQQIGHENVQWPLKQLVVNLSNISEPVKWQEIGNFFQNLEFKFGSTLKELDIYFPHVFELTSEITLTLPHLTSLSIEMMSCFSLDFLLPLKNNLKYLDVRVERSFKYVLISGPAPVLNEKTVKFFTTDRPPVDTNIWEIFPKLEKLKYWHRFDHMEKTYTRKK